MTTRDIAEKLATEIMHMDLESVIEGKNPYARLFELFEQALTQHAQAVAVFCGCGDGIQRDDGALCGTCAAKERLQIDSLAAENVVLREALKPLSEQAGEDPEVIYPVSNTDLMKALAALASPSPETQKIQDVLEAAKNVKIVWRTCQGEYPRQEMLTLVEAVEALERGE